MDDEVDEKINLIKVSYDEVLDATKHQDDKIGRLLTSVAFLTAAALALAALAGAGFVTRPFVVTPVELPLGLIATAAFLVGVVFTVMLLLTSLGTPLRLPGLAEVPDTGARSRPEWTGNTPASQIYFAEIAGLSLREWQEKWEAPADHLRRERLRSLVRETHNLGIRTNFKYDRTTEAVALLSLSLLSFGLAVVFVAVAAATPGQGPVVLDPLHRVVIATVFGAYVGVQLLARIRHARQSVDDTVPRGDGSRLRLRLAGELLYALMLALLVADVVAYDPSWGYTQAWGVVTGLLAVASLAGFWRATTPDRTSPADGSVERAGRRRSRRQRLVLCAVTVPLTVAAVVSAAVGWYAGQLAVSVAAVLCLILPSALTSTLAMRARRAKYQARQRASTTGTQTAAEPPTSIDADREGTNTEPSGDAGGQTTDREAGVTRPGVAGRVRSPD